MMELTVSHRHASDPQYSAFVQTIGEGTVGEAFEPLNADSEPIPNASVVPLQFAHPFSMRTH